MIAAWNRQVRRQLQIIPLHMLTAPRACQPRRRTPRCHHLCQRRCPPQSRAGCPFPSRGSPQARRLVKAGCRCTGSIHSLERVPPSPTFSSRENALLTRVISSARIQQRVLGVCALLVLTITAKAEKTSNLPAARMIPIRTKLEANQVAVERSRKPDFC